MKQTLKTVVFFGSGPVAARALELLHHDFEIEAVVTKPRPAHHRGSVPVLELAERLELPVFTPANKSELTTLCTQKKFESPLGIVIDYGIIISQEAIDTFPLGIINSHFSLLPEWRGADPITFSILSGQKRTGVSLMLIVAAMDEGPLLAQAEYDLPAKITTPELTEDLIELSHELLRVCIPAYIAGEIDPAPQESVSLADKKKPTYSRKLTKEDGIIDWSKPADQLEREIRGFIEWPKSRTTLAKKEVVITEASVVTNPGGKPGTIHTENKLLVVSCGKQALQISKLKPAGKPEMTAEAFLAGYKSLL